MRQINTSQYKNFISSFILGMNMPGMGVGNLGTMGAAGALSMTGIPGLGNMTGVSSVGGNIQTGDALTQAYSGIQQYNGK